MRKRIFLIAFLAVCMLAGSSAESATSACDTNGDGVAVILVPIAFSAGQVVQGAHGTRWTGEIWIHNSSSSDLGSVQPGNCEPQCAIAFPAGTIRKISGVESNHNDGGALLHVPFDVARDFHFSARLLELTRRAQPTGVDLPVVGECDFFSRPTSYLSIPVGPGIRSTLRVYDPRLKRGSAVRVEFLSPDNLFGGRSEVIATTILRPGDDPVVPEVVPRHYFTPGFAAILDITQAFPQLQSYERFHIRVTPLTEGTEYWAFVSITDNETQHVLLVTSQP